MLSVENPKLLKSRQFHSRLFAVVAIFLLLTTRPEMAADSYWRIFMLWFGYALVVLGSFGRVYCSCFIGGRKNTEIIRNGPFSIVRNPLYVFSFIATVGISMQSGMLTVSLLLPLSFALYYPLVVKKEEEFLRHKFGAAYDVYMQEVPRWRPNFSLWKEPEETSAMPEFIRRTAFDAMVFFLALPLFSLISFLQSNEILPIWLTLP